MRKAPSEYWKASANITKFAEYALMVDTISGNSPEPAELKYVTPKTYKEATLTKEWSNTMMEEYQALMSNGTWVLTTLPHNRKAIGSKWTFCLKENADRTVARYKARLVAKGLHPNEGCRLQ